MGTAVTNPLASLRAALETQQALISASPLPIVVLNADDTVTIWNHAAERVFGWSEPEVLGRPLPFIPREKQDEHLQMRRRDLSGTGFVEQEIVRVRKDGTAIELCVSTASVRDDTGAITAIISIYQDITTRKQAERALRNSEARFKAIVNQATAGIAQTDLTGRFVLVNDRYCQIVGRSREELLGLYMQDLTALEDLPHNLEMFHRLLDDGGDFVIEKRYVRPEGTHVWVSNTVSLVRSPEGTPEYVVAVVLDITDRREAELALQRANAELEQFAFSASHDLKEPLRNVTIYSQLLQRKYGGQIDTQADDYLNTIIKSAQRMDVLVRDLLAYNRAATLDAVSPVRVDCNAVIARVIENLGPESARLQARVVVDKLPAVCGHDVHIGQLFQNLIGNALKYHKPGSPPKVWVSAHPLDAMWRFMVRDEGIGIDAVYHERIFGLFKRLHTNEQYEGTGIGLAICEKIVQRYGGRIWVDSAPGEGATFSFTLPAK